jgi:biopolymer transport protein ExbD
MEDGKPEVNATPLIDVMLVLLVMLIITVPLATHQTTVNLPFGETSKLPPAEVHLVIDFDDRIFWNGTEITDEMQLSRLLRAAAMSAEGTIVRVEPDKRARYEPVAQVLAAAQRAEVVDVTVRGVSD